MLKAMLSVLLSAIPLSTVLADAAAGGFAVLKVVRGEETTFVAVASEKASEEKSRLVREAKEAREDWQKARDVFAAKKDNRGLDFPEPEPETAEVSKAKEGLATEEEAEAWAEEQQEKARRWAVLKITGIDGTPAHEICEQAKIRTREAALRAEYEKAYAEWQKSISVATGGGGGGKGGKGLGVGKGGGGKGGVSVSASAAPTKPKVLRVREKIPTQKEAEKLLAELSR